MIAPVLSLILGLGVTRLLLGFVTVFRIRAAAPADWLPLVWGGILFVEQIQFWWAISGLSMVRTEFSFPDFLLLVVLPLLLFLSSALILPNRAEDETRGLRGYFDRDGRFALLPLALYYGMATVVNAVYFRAPLLHPTTGLNLALGLNALVVFLSGRRKVQEALTLAFLPLLLADFGVGP